MTCFLEVPKLKLWHFTSDYAWARSTIHELVANLDWLLLSQIKKKKILQHDRKYISVAFINPAAEGADNNRAPFCGEGLEFDLDALNATQSTPPTPPHHMACRRLAALAPRRSAHSFALTRACCNRLTKRYRHCRASVSATRAKP